MSFGLLLFIESTLQNFTKALSDESKIKVIRYLQTYGPVPESLPWYTMNVLGFNVALLPPPILSEAIESVIRVDSQRSGLSIIRQ